MISLATAYNHTSSHATIVRVCAAAALVLGTVALTPANANAQGSSNTPRALASQPSQRSSTVTPPLTRSSRGANANIATIANAWAYPALKGGTGGAYFTVQNNTSHAIQIVGVSARISASAELHETTHAQNMAHMQMRRSVKFGAHQTLKFEPGGMHVMLPHLTQAMVANDTVRFELHVTTAAPPSAEQGATVRIPVLVIVRRP